MKRIHVVGGVYIPIATGLTNLYDFWDDTDTGQDLVSGVITGTPTLYIPLHPQVKRFSLTEIRIGYVDSANVNDLANVILYDSSNATDELNQQAIIWQSGAVAETPTTSVGSVTYLDPPRLVELTDQSKLYFITTWTTAVISCGAATEFFYLKIKGYVDSPN